MRICDPELTLRDRRFDRLIERLPSPTRPVARWLRSPSARPVRIPAGALLCVGGVFGILPVLGFWMLPAGLVLLAEDMPPLARSTGRMLDWVERRRPHWLAPEPGSSNGAVGDNAIAPPHSGAGPAKR
jgi:hypothetical protein